MRSSASTPRSPATRAPTSAIGFAIPSATVKSIADTLISSGKVEHAYLGVSVQEIPSTVAGQLGAVGGVEITKVQSNTPAERANLIGSTGEKTVDGQRYSTGGDVITAIDGQKVTTAEGVQQAIDAHHPGDTIQITYWRKGDTKTVSVKLATRPAQIPVGEAASRHVPGPGPGTCPFLSSFLDRSQVSLSRD